MDPVLLALKTMVLKFEVYASNTSERLVIQAAKEAIAKSESKEAENE